MKKFNSFLLMLLLTYTANIAIAQHNCMVHEDNFQLPPNRSHFSGNGKCHTPKGNLHMLVIFVAIEGIEDIEGYDDWEYNKIPTWAQGESNELFDKSPTTIGNTKNLSLYYKKMSDNKFIVTGEVFPEQIILPTNTNNYQAICDEISRRYPDYNWSRFDNRTNYPNFASDNSVYEPDKNIDYVYFVFRRPDAAANGSTAASGLLKTLYTGSKETYTINSGHTANAASNDVKKHWVFFQHEFAHNLFNCPHYFGANSDAADGDYFYTSTGWGQMGGSQQIFDVSNAWERWWLDWIEPQEVTQNGKYQIKDYVTTHDAIRIPIPNTNPTEYLWIENHQFLDPLYDKKLFGHVKDITPGLYMYVTKLGANRNSVAEVNPHLTSATNSIKVLNRKGNREILWTGEYLYGSEVFESNIDNPISGQNVMQYIRSDFDNNGEILTYNGHGNYTSTSFINEMEDMWLEKINGVNEITWAMEGNGNDGFYEGDEIGLSGIIPILNYPEYNKHKVKLDPYNLSSG
jgi:M6 family metalloprotease-like protein